MIHYQFDLHNLSPDHLDGFFVGWPNPPDQATHWRILEHADEIVLAIDDATGAVIGFINAITDGVLTAYIPLLEVLPDYQGRGIGRELIRRMIERLAGYYMIDLVARPDLEGFYESVSMQRQLAMVIRDFKNQSGRRHDDSPIV